MKLPEGMSRAHREAPPPPPSPRTLLVVLLMLVLLGTAGTFASVYTARTTQTASRADVMRSNELIAQVARLEEAGNRDVALHRERNELLHADQCRLIYEVIMVAPSLRDQGIEPCRPPLLDVSPSPSPAAR